VQVTVLSGAGMSAESGVPTFRDVETGLWAKVDPYEISSSDGWRRHPEKVWAWYLWRHYMMKAVEPNDGHRAVAAWQDGASVDVVTQNVDDLHERAGSLRVHHLHGSLFHFRCDRCGSTYDGPLPAMPEPVENVDPPRCGCGGLIRPEVVWFGEQLPTEAWERSVEAVSRADVAIVVGTSAIVYPAASLPELALAEGIPVIEVNPEETPLSGRATISLREKAAMALPGLLQRLPVLLG
jgi:NAD-dependent deacetylase